MATLKSVQNLEKQQTLIDATWKKATVMINAKEREAASQDITVVMVELVEEDHV
jgi:hypothetical protein